jgi:tetratricopeptide (TPR) repeat protein
MNEEATTLMSTRVRTVQLVLGLLPLAFLAVSAPLLAQRAQTNRPRIMIAAFQSADRNMGAQAAEALRNRVSRDAGERGVYVVPKADIEATLAASGYSTTEALAPNDAKALASLIRAEEYVDGVVTRTATGYHIEARLVLARDNQVTQVLPPADAPSLDAAAQQLSRNVLEARRQVDAERECSGALRAGDAPRAIAAAERGLRANARFNNMIRVCLATAYVRQDTPRPADTSQVVTEVVTARTLQVAEQILASDPRNIPALKIAAIGYKSAQATAGSDTAAANRFEARYIQTLTTLVAADPSDLRLQEQVVNELAASGRASLAVPIVLDALQANPGDPRMMRTAWLVLLAAEDFERAIRVGEELVRVDTAAATADYFRRLAVAYTRLNRRPQAIQVLQRATARAPNDPALWALYSQTLRQAGQSQAAIDAARRGLAINPANQDAHFQLVEAYIAAGQIDNAATAIRAAATAGVQRNVLSQIALKQGNDAYRAGQASRARADYERAIRFLQLSQELEANLDAQFLLGASAFSLGDILTREGQASRSCSTVQRAQEAFVTARTNITAAQSRYPDPARQLLEAIGQFTTPLSQMARAYCR